MITTILVILAVAAVGTVLVCHTMHRLFADELAELNARQHVGSRMRDADHPSMLVVDEPPRDAA